PVVVTPTDGSKEIINQHENGIIVPFNSPKLLAEAYLELQQNPDLCLKYGKNARSLVQKRFNSLRVSEQVTNIYKAIIK
ncbi:MAG: glycosyltransferase, partial [Phocaeicola sp.]